MDVTPAASSLLLLSLLSSYPSSQTARPLWQIRRHTSSLPKNIPPGQRVLWPDPDISSGSGGPEERDPPTPHHQLQQQCQHPTQTLVRWELPCPRRLRQDGLKVQNGECQGSRAGDPGRSETSSVIPGPLIQGSCEAWRSHWAWPRGWGGWSMTLPLELCTPGS